MTITIDDTLEYKLPLPKEFRKKWLEDLRSGKFKQTDQILYNNEVNGYCCLGVACTQYIPSDLFSGFAMPEDFFYYSKKSKANSLLEAYEEKLILLRSFFKSQKDLSANQIVLACSKEDLDMEIYMHSFKNKLATFNDDGHTFKQIADFIERNTINKE